VHSDEQLLMEAQEDILVNWIKVQVRRGIPMTYSSIAQAAGAISGKQMGDSWPKRFNERHGRLKMKKTTPLEKACAKALNQSAVDGFFNLLTEVITKYNIQSENIYNMDEKRSS
jgi:hypothetical protein